MWFNGRSHGNILQMNTEPSLLELCWVQLDIHAIKKIQKPRKVFAKPWAEEACLLCHDEKTSSKKKFRANEYRVKFTWTMLSAAEILYKKRSIIAHVTEQAIRKTHLKVYRKNSKKFAWEVIHLTVTFFSCSFLMCLNGLFSRRSRWWSQTKQLWLQDTNICVRRRHAMRKHVIKNDEPTL